MQGNIPAGHAGKRDGKQESSFGTVKGRSGYTLRLSPLESESHEEIVGLIDGAIPKEHRSSLITISTDSPLTMVSQLDDLRKRYPNLHVVEEDILHGKIRFEKTSGGKESDASNFLRDPNQAFFVNTSSEAAKESYR